MRQLEARGPLIKEQREALDAVPMWRVSEQPLAASVQQQQPRRQTRSSASSQTTPSAPAKPGSESERAPLLSQQPRAEAPPPYHA